MMGTNYYTVNKYCDHCNQYEKDLHIGKSSYGWCFSFQGYKYMNLVSWKQWKEYLKDKTIVDEYGDKKIYDDIVEMIETYKSPSAQHSKYHHNKEGKKQGWFNDEYDWDDEDGYPFSSREFS
jgi:hypothetical protein